MAPGVVVGTCGWQQLGWEYLWIIDFLKMLVHPYKLYRVQFQNLKEIKAHSM